MSISLSEKKAPVAVSGKVLNYGLWTAQILLAVGFGIAGYSKLATPIAELAKQLPWVASAPGLTRFIGLSEFAGALGLILPSVTRIKPILTPIAALGLVTVMILASLFHISRGEFQMLPVTLVLGALSAFVAYGRLKKSPIESK